MRRFLPTRDSISIQILQRVNARTIAGRLTIFFATHLHPGFRQIDLQRDLLAHEDVGVLRLRKEAFQHVQLRASERRSLPPLLPRIAFDATEKFYP